MDAGAPSVRDRGRNCAIRLARHADLPSLADVEKEAATRFAAAGVHGSFLDDTLSASALLAAATEGRLWVADLDGACVGFVLTAVLDDGQAWLEEVDVLPAFGGLGLGRRLVETAIAWARQRGAPSISLCTFRDLPWNAPFYAKMGFLEVPSDARSRILARIVEEERARGLPVERRVLMRLTLTADGTPS